ncbi:MAG: radical SAM/SPASM domain-containing protein [Thermoanaerobaculia bacterium]
MIRQLIERITQPVGPPLPRPEPEPRLEPSPYLHVSEEAVHNPMTDRTVAPGEADFRLLQEVLRGGRPPSSLPAEDRDRLRRDGWLYDPDDLEDLTRGFYLKYVSLEAHTVCNQSCYFCPVSVAPREPHFMPMDQYREILRQLGAYRSTIEAVFMIAYNEPTLDKRFVEQVRAIREAGLQPATLTNGSGLTPERVDALVEMGGLRFLSINLSTMDREAYRRDRGKDQAELVLRNLEHARDLPVAEQMDIVVLGPGDDRHQRDFEEICERFAGSRFSVKHFVVNDRAGLLEIGTRAEGSQKPLRGCDLMGSRPIQHLHVDPYARCILCCQDYHGTHVVGDLNESTVEEVLTGPVMRRMRKMIYGLEEAPPDFICRNCAFAITG